MSEGPAPITPRRLDRGFRWRGEADVSRLESFTDGVFAIVLALVFLRAEPPLSFGDLDAALRSMVTRETTQQRADAEREVREMNARVLEFEETLTRRQDDAQQEFLLLHNQAVAHAERITADANEQVTSSLEHSKRISAKADDYERLMRSQAQAIEADAQVRARETLDRARQKAQKIVSTVTGHTTDVLRDAEDRTRQLRWQQQQLNSFMAEVRELIRPEGVVDTDTSDGDTEDADDVDVLEEGDEIIEIALETEEDDDSEESDDEDDDSDEDDD